MKQSVYEVGTFPPLGTVPESMYASVIRPERYGEPVDAFRTEVVPVPAVGRRQVLVLVMAAGINYNNVWAAMGQPVDVVAARRRRGDAENFHIGGSDGSGIVWAVGEDVSSVAVGDHVIMSFARWDETAEDIRLGCDPMLSSSQTISGYEENYGSFAQFALVEDFQCHPKPRHLTWESAGCFLVTGGTAYRQLTSWTPNVVGPGDPVLIWGGAGGLGSMAIQLVRSRGGIPIAVVSDGAKADYCRRLGAHGVINRRDFDHWGRLPDIDDTDAIQAWLTGARRFTVAYREALGSRQAPRIVFEHTGEGTIPTSMYLCDNGGMVVICGGTSGFNADIDLRFLWMRQKRLQGSHYANLRECRSMVELVSAGIVDPCLSWCGEFDEIGKAHQLMRENQHPPGNLGVLVNAPRRGMTSDDIAV